ncbi:MAG: hypothetical protein J6W04_00750 [Bacteroidales bacterium]|nr:hypothetical protein [Bacteroidales bacterium]
MRQCKDCKFYVEGMCRLITWVNAELNHQKEVPEDGSCYMFEEKQEK